MHEKDNYLKTTSKKVIFLTWDELNKLKDYQIPKDKPMNNEVHLEYDKVGNLLVERNNLGEMRIYTYTNRNIVMTVWRNSIILNEEWRLFLIHKE